MDAALLFEPDGYLLDRPQLMGRQSAGNGFLRAAVAANSGGRLSAYTPSRNSFDAFAQTVRALDASVDTHWISANRTDLLAAVGTLYRPDAGIPHSARLRLREGLGAYSLCGVTHTMCSDNALELLLDMLTTPVMPWDGLICTSQVALALVRERLEGHAEYLGWRLGHKIPAPQLQLPVIPLGVQVDDFTATTAERAQARASLGIAEDEVVALFAGRLSFSGKAHPVSMLRGLQAAHERTGRRIVLIQAGSFFNGKIAGLYRDAAAEFSPDVRPLFVEGRDFEAYAASWRAADLFVSLADSIQETFGLTPVEAMAAGLPVVVSDWNGYKDTVRDGIDGYRIPSWAPPQVADDSIARSYESRMSNFDTYLVRVGGAVSIDQRELDDRLSALVDDPDLRARLGGAARARARQDYDWAVIYRQYRAFWAELGEIRRNLTAQPDWAARIAAAPREHPVWPDPYRLFAHYPTSLVTPQTQIRFLPDASLSDFERLTTSPLFAFSSPSAELVAVLLESPAAVTTIAEVAAGSGRPEKELIDAAARLAKIGLIAFERD